MTTLRSGAASDVGKVRRNNQDQFLMDEPLFAVADGMGGAAGGEEASATAVAALKVAFDADPTADGLADGVRNANRAVWEKALERPELRGMGTTMTAVALVDGGDDGDDEVLAVANVGDSRVYLLRDGRLDQITDDHSVPEELVRAGRITPEEAVSHPQRNMLTRVLGNEPEVEVDCFAIIPYSGDRLVLASDGLFNEVDHDGIAAVARRQADPEKAAAELVRMARESGGNDNITVVVVDVVDDGDRAARASVAVAGTPPPAPRTGGGAPPPQSGRRTADGATTTEPGNDATGVLRPAAGGAAAGASGPGAGVLDDVSTDAPSHWSQARPSPPTRGAADVGAPPPAASAPRQRRFTLRVVVFLVALVVLAAGAAAAIGFFARGGYFVGVDKDEVVIYKGMPGGLLWFDPTVADRTGVVVADLTPARRQDIEAGKEEPSLAAALRYVAQVKEEATASTTTTMTLPPTTVAPPAPPASVTP
ncbi:MAG: Stp1/IreP family PP2C-type Ser/Thr phosphatase [Acidimicrobiales bacterium]